MPIVIFYVKQSFLFCFVSQVHVYELTVLVLRMILTLASQCVEIDFFLSR